MFGLPLLLIYLLGIPFSVGFFWQASDQRDKDVPVCVVLGVIWPAVPLLALGMKVAMWLKVHI